MIYDKFFKDKNSTYKIKKIFCVLEGKDELLLVKRIFELIVGNVIDCENILKKIEVKWGKDIIWEKKKECNFKGGSLSGCITPWPAVEALKSANIELYEGIVIIYDKDCDERSEVEKQIKDLLDRFNYVLNVNNPCLEKEILYLIKTDDTIKYIENSYEIINNSKCKWYKSNFARIPKKEIYRYCQKFEKVIMKLDVDSLHNDKKFSDLYTYIKNFLKKVEK